MRRVRRSPPSLVVKMRVGVKPGQWGWPYGELVASWRAAEEEGMGIEPPPIIVGGRSEPTMAVAARHADGWNAVVADAGDFAQLAAQLDRLCVRVERERPLARAAQVVVRDIDLTSGRELLRELEQGGAESVTFVLVAERGPDAVRALAGAVL